MEALEMMRVVDMVEEYRPCNFHALLFLVFDRTAAVAIDQGTIAQEEW
jgi:hypothetical protein